MKTLTKHRKMILENMASRKDHPTAKMVYDSARNFTDKLSFATVYNSLEYLVIQGLIKKLDIDSASARYDATLDSHSHFICRKCENVFDLPSIEITDEQLQILEKDFSPEEVTVTIRGICMNCNKHS